MNLAGIILAAGMSSRMGSPKALLVYRGETFVDRLIGLLAPHCHPVIVVLGHDAERIHSAMARADLALVVVNREYRRGQLSSLQAGLKAVPEHSQAVMFVPVDHAAIRPQTVAAVAGAAGRAGPAFRLAVPETGGRRGHPVVCSRELAAELLALDPDGEARTVIRRHAADRIAVPVDDPAVLRDVDDPAAYAALCAEAIP
jgi:molybdenum cofactor cytidylyltransferase